MLIVYNNNFSNCLSCVFMLYAVKTIFVHGYRGIAANASMKRYVRYDTSSKRLLYFTNACFFFNHCPIVKIYFVKK